MNTNLRIGLAQINSTVGDLFGNCEKIKEYLSRAVKLGVDIVSFPELAVTGYPPEDLLHKQKFVRDNLAALKEIAVGTKGLTAIVGFVDKGKNGLYNAAAIISEGKIKGVYHKMLLPNYGVFDERRYFQAGDKPLVFRIGKVVFGVNICEDVWHMCGPTVSQAKAGAGIIFNINASPFSAGKVKEREEIVKKQARLNKVFLAYNNLVGAQDELVFDGQSMVVGSQGKVIARAEAFKEDLLVLDLNVPETKLNNAKKAVVVQSALPLKDKKSIENKIVKTLDYVPEVYKALVLGLSDYVCKNGFKKVVIGLSGGIDSGIVAALAKEALGKDNVVGVFMPSRYSSGDSRQDAVQLADNLGIKFLDIPIEDVYKTYLLILEPHFAGRNPNIAEENLQARIRGNILMALSNKFGWLVLTTGNKSEMSTGYATLYGDMAGGFAVIKDVPKTLVYKLAAYINTNSNVIPQRMITKEPTAELKPNQKDSDTLPKYEELDPILKAYVEEDKELEKIVNLGFDREVVSKVLLMVDNSEYKRRQSPPGIKITPKAFGRDRRMPITNRYRG
ncbi:MAG: NAD+ synthase [Candidatus Omnitrophica bacterium]|nr:NAD+ synthase [Candidatus Omnitrophota bacterium]